MVNDKSRMNREIHVRFRESLRVKLFWATRLRGWSREAPAYSITKMVCEVVVLVYPFGIVGLMDTN